MDYKKLISKIKSVRDYKKTPVSLEILNELKLFYENSRKLMDDIEIEVLIKNSNEVYDKVEGMAGYNEYMIKAPHYLLILSDVQDYYIENIGYVGENLMLKANELGVDSCWITFKNGDEIKKKLSIDSEKRLTALIALGYDDNKTKVFNDTDVKGYNPSKADIKKVEDNISYRLGVEDIVYMKEWGERTNGDDLSSRGLLEAFNYARLAPSILNRQPWRFIIDDDIIVLAIRYDNNINDYEYKIDTGIIMLYFEVVVDSTLLDITWVMGKPNREFKIPEDYTIVGYSTI